ncbi:hypothetical protein DMB66_09055, partial [Actinoplanes sp. ATCC 53533]|uniref:hypothetical protein n=1 Tax=Actinoplanes sp. ATCC 53533 TaxID=1288362 RepID=UPI001002A7E9
MARVVEATVASSWGTVQVRVVVHAVGLASAVRAGRALAAALLSATLPEEPGRARWSPTLRPAGRRRGRRLRRGRRWGAVDTAAALARTSAAGLTALGRTRRRLHGTRGGLTTLTGTTGLAGRTGLTSRTGTTGLAGTATLTRAAGRLTTL